MLEDGLKEKGKGGYPISKSVLPGCLLGVLGMFNEEASEGYKMLGRKGNLDNTRSKTDLGIEYKADAKDLLTTTAMSLIKLGVVEDKVLAK